MTLKRRFSAADPDFELRGGTGLVLLALPTFLFSVISSFLIQNKGGPGPPGASPRSATDFKLIPSPFDVRNMKPFRVNRNRSRARQTHNILTYNKYLTNFVVVQ